MIIDEPRASLACVLRAALPIMAPLVTLGVMLSLLPLQSTLRNKKLAANLVVISPYARLLVAMRAVHGLPWRSPIALRPTRISQAATSGVRDEPWLVTAR